MYCQNCGSKLPETAKFCPSCGSAVLQVEQDPDPTPVAPSSGKLTFPDMAPDAIRPKSALSDKWLWCLATLPVLIMSVVQLLHPLSALALALCYIVLNTLFTIFDRGECFECGYDASCWVFYGLLFLPAYFIVRASKTNKNYWPFIVWLILFILDNGILVFRII